MTTALAERTTTPKASKHLTAAEEKLARASAILEEFGDADLPDEKFGEVNQLLADADRLRARAAQARKAEELNQFFNESVTREVPLVRKNPFAEGPRIEVGRDHEEERPFRNQQEYLLAVMRAGQGHNVPQLARFRASAGTDEQSRFSDPDGGFLVPEEFSPTLLQTAADPDPVAGRTTLLPMGSPVLNIPARVDKDHSQSVSGGLIVTRRPESVEAQASRTKLDKVKLEAFSIFGLSFLTEELLSDSPISIPALLIAGFQDQFNSHMLEERLTGTGVGEYLGIMNSPCLVTVPKEAGQEAGTIVLANVAKMKSRCYGYRKAIWLYNHDCLPQLIGLTDKAGNAFWQASARDGEPDRLLGRPAFETEHCQALGTAGDIVLTNWSEYLEGTLTRGMESAVSVHARFVQHERAFKFWLRNGGAPWWKSPLQPKRGSTKSPFVTLEARA